MSDDQVSMRFNPDEPNKLDEIVRGSYEDFVRLERRNLLGISALTMFLIFGNARPTNAAILGFSLNVDTAVMFKALFLASAYFTVAYFIYAYPGYRTARQKWNGLKRSAMKISGQRHRPSIEAKNIISTARYRIWLFVNYEFPLFFGLLSTASAIYKIAA